MSVKGIRPRSKDLCSSGNNSINSQYPLPPLVRPWSFLWYICICDQWYWQISDNSFDGLVRIVLTESVTPVLTDQWQQFWGFDWLVTRVMSSWQISDNTSEFLTDYWQQFWQITKLVTTVVTDQWEQFCRINKLVTTVLTDQWQQFLQISDNSSDRSGTAVSTDQWQQFWQISDNSFDRSVTTVLTDQWHQFWQIRDNSFKSIDNT